MHISEGVLSMPILAAGVAVAAAGVAVGMKKMGGDSIPKVAVLSSAFFVASLVHVPIGPTSVHLVLNGLLGILLGWPAFPAILVALFLQAMLFQFGGWTTLGINTVNMALPAVLCFYFFHGAAEGGTNRAAALAGFGAGFLSVALSGLFVAVTLALSEGAFLDAAKVIFLAHLPVMVIEGIVTSVCILFLRRVKREILTAS
ncbi:MAG TPA: cobalt transporter CbiM [Syntrophales bacterium]|nr:cobalt transporter CbiM [Syntrophales bacterium]HPX12467.1 cobalt transporter CbiM [Syntrophales bacterium]HQB30600.1 cobalt transporter CbiM [Syntrophales bacterium]HQN78017.1 cobalt transporter CbiM [Syntrophales bacterium]HQQ26984.1 cobalt transporter CbiM [Syntrophales bacterium]